MLQGEQPADVRIWIDMLWCIIWIDMLWCITKREKAESEAQRGKPKGSLIDGRSDLAPTVDRNTPSLHT